MADDPVVLFNLVHTGFFVGGFFLGIAVGLLLGRLTAHH
jgi:hypothetical protein